MTINTVITVSLKEGHRLFISSAFPFSFTNRLPLASSLYEFLSWVGLKRMSYYVFSLRLKRKNIGQNVGAGLYVNASCAPELSPKVGN